MWVIAVMDKLFCKSTNSSADRTTGSKDMSISRICMDFCYGKILYPFLMEELPCNPPVTR